MSSSLSPEWIAEFERALATARARSGLPPRRPAPLGEAAGLVIDSVAERRHTWPEREAAQREWAREQAQRGPGPERAAVEQIKTYSELNRLAVALRVDGPARIWYWLRHLDSRGRGWLDMNDEVRVHLVERGAVPTLRTLRRHLRAGEGLFWTRQGERLYLHGLARVALDLIGLAGEKAPDALTYAQSTRAPAGRAVDMPAWAWESVQRWRAAAFAAWVGVRCGGDDPRGVTASALCLARLWGCSPRTIWSWASRGGVRTRRNLACALQPDATQDSVSQYPGDVLEPDCPRAWRVGDLLCWQLPSTFYAEPALTRPGMARRLLSRMAERGRCCGQPVDIWRRVPDATRPLRLYWQDYSALKRWRRRANKPHGPRVRPGVALTAYVKTVSGPRSGQYSNWRRQWHNLIVDWDACPGALPWFECDMI